jgi:GDP-D-mannose dehydratase
VGVIRPLGIARVHVPDSMICQASSTEMVGHLSTEQESEPTQFRPSSPYGVAKVHGYWACINYGTPTRCSFPTEAFQSRIFPSWHRVHPKESL